MPVPLIDLTRQYAGIKPEIDAAVTRVFGHGQFILGREVKDFETAFAQKCQVTEAIGVASGSDALLLALDALGVGPGDEVIVPTFTFFATASAVTRLGARPVFCDIHESDYNINVDDADARTTRRTRAIIAVHLYGQMADMRRLRELTWDRGLWLVEDAAQAVGARFDGGIAGSSGDMACFSFFPTKNLGGAGDGGMVTTDDPALAERVRLLRTHGAQPKYHHQIVGYNSRLDALQAAILNVKLARFEAWTNRRRVLADVYDRELAGVGDIVSPTRTDGAFHIFHQYTIATDRRDALRRFLHEAGIGSEIYYPVPLHLQTCFAGLGGRPGDCPVAERASRRALSLPIFPEMTEGEQAEVIETLRRFFSSHA